MTHDIIDADGPYRSDVIEQVITTIGKLTHTDTSHGQQASMPQPITTGHRIALVCD